jgi:hypothetical protein
MCFFRWRERHEAQFDATYPLLAPLGFVIAVTEQGVCAHTAPDHAGRMAIAGIVGETSPLTLIELLSLRPSQDCLLRFSRENQSRQSPRQFGAQ